jgi:hypothetical protein
MPESGLCGGASSMTMLIAVGTVWCSSQFPFNIKLKLGKLICSRQCLGGGGIALLINTVVADLVSLRERGKYIALTQMAATLELPSAR